MNYTITALATSEDNLQCLQRNLLAAGAPRETIIVRAGQPGISQAQISITTNNLEASESYRDTLTLAGAKSINSSEESSAFNIIR